MSGAMAGFMSGLAQGIENRQDRDREKARDEAAEAAAVAKRRDDWWSSSEGHYAQPNGSGGLMPDGPPRQPSYSDRHPARGGRSLSRPTGGAPPRLKVADPAATDLPPEARAFLNGVAGGESAGAYNVRYTPDGAATFDIAQGHPNILEATHDGRKSSAAGRYQFTGTTWGEYGGDDFSPAAQDRAAWALATDRYSATTGRDLLGDLRQNGMSHEIQAALAPTWAALGNEGNRGKWAALYDNSLSRYGSGGQPASRQSSKPAARPAAKPQGRALGASKPKRKTWAWTDDVMSGLELKGSI